jgi:hypothetical protein
MKLKECIKVEKFGDIIMKENEKKMVILKIYDEWMKKIY